MRVSNPIIIYIIIYLGRFSGGDIELSNPVKLRQGPAHLVRTITN